MKLAASSVTISALLWAGLVLGGSLIAAPAKFTVTSLDLPTALEVGRAQFRWVAIGELVLIVTMLASMTFSFRPSKLWLFLPVVIFAVQWLIVMPSLDERTIRIIAQENTGSSHLHLIYIVLELTKFFSLSLSAGLLLLRESSRS